MQVWTWQNRCLLMVIFTHRSRRDTWFSCLLPRDAAQLFTLHVLLRWQNSCTSPVQKHTWIHLHLLVTFSDFLSLSSLLENIQCFEKALSPEITLFFHKKDPVSPCFLFIGQGWFIRFLHSAHIHVIKKTSNRCTDIWSSMNSWKGSWGFPVFDEQVKSQSRGSRKLGFMYSPPNNLFQLGWGFEGKRKTILVLSNLRQKKWSIMFIPFQFWAAILILSEFEE